ncbi:2-deoxy-D-gluconate 3-dehydrogenase [Sphingobacterium siyangense]|uniref:SDR family oxidoreductase n=3 Tax=Sphingobacteriaceae TaxID=84566 RepID=A0ABX7CWA4_SPHMU|nr:2-deoxy-D-gluconate 3-dehydrogenase [Sphingobacterium sp. UME9]QQT33636.1 SDR family oxidoreductase [Sphingobacterium multivorum]QQT56401.1 SDR family oxidoreductase [Sphingobacterium multivorum]QRY60768.1 SDR family oxidoreductase [Sphingobacterium siyangense]RKF35012.1 2-deoxy-D-gluconate 3-dehydrogenase [Sphingobacterium siyangense]
MMEEYKNKVVLISGGLGDIGRAMAEAFLTQQAIVCISDRFEPQVARARWPLLDDAGARLFYDQVDVADARQVDAWVQRIRQELGAISICIANAACVTIKDFSTLSNEEWKNEMAVNLDGSFFLANACAKSFVETELAGSIIFMGSWAAHAVHQNLPAYSVSKAGLRMLCQAMALEYAAYGIRVNEIAPGYVNAGLSKVVWSSNAELQMKAKAVVPLGQIIEAEEVAKQVLWICSDNCKHMTGTAIVMDGGLSLIRP